MVTMRARFRCWVALPAMLILPNQKLEAQIDFATVKREVSAAQARHLEQAEYAQVDSIGEQYDELNNRAPVSKVHSKTRRSGQFYLAEDSVELAPPPNLKGLIPRRKSGVAARNSHYAFSLTRPGGPGEWRLKDLHLDNSADPLPSNLKTESLAQGTLFVRPYSLNPTTLMELFDTPSFRLLSCGSSPSDPAVVRVQFESTPPTVDKKPQAQLNGWCDLDPQVGWSIRGVEISVNYPIQSTKVRTDIKSTLDENGFVRIGEERQEIWVKSGNTLDSHRTQLNTYKIWQDRDIPEREFSLSAYGLPEPPGITFARPTPTYVWFLLGAAGFTVLAIAFRWLARRKPVPSAL